MILQWIYDKLQQKVQKKRHEVLKLEWQRAKLRSELEKAKVRRNEQ